MSLAGKVIEFYDSDFKRRKAIVVDRYAGIASIDKLGRVNNYNEPSVGHVSIDYLLCTLIEDEEKYLTGEMFSLQPSRVISAVECINFYMKKD